MTPEEKARQNIDRLLDQAGWKVQDLKELNLGTSLGVAVREYPLTTGEADYLLFVDRKAVGVIEAKPEGDTLSGVSEQTAKYLTGAPTNLPAVQTPLPLAYESTGVETFTRDLRDPDSRSRRVFAFHAPEAVRESLSCGDTLRARLRQMPPLLVGILRTCQVEAIQSLESSLAASRPRALIQMASGGGKTFTAISSIYRLIKFSGARRILFLVDRGNLARQTEREFQQYETPDDGRKFTQLYNVQRLTSNTIDPVSKVCITTIQRLYSMLSGESEFDSELEERSTFEDLSLGDKPREVTFNPRIPIETFDFIITDECHRSIYHLWRPVLEYFDGFIVGLTATPSKQTLGFFDQNLVTEYSHEQAVADGVNVGYDVYRIKTHITEKGSTVQAGYYVDKREKRTRKVRWEQLEKVLQYQPSQLDRDVVAKSQIRTVIRTFRDKLFTEIFPGRTEVPKTLVFAKDDSHAEDIVHIIREEFGKGNDFCKKITYRTGTEDPEQLLASFRNSYNPRIAVTVDMVATGTDVRPLECLLFMRDVKSQTYFEQMKGRGTRTVSTTELQGVSPDARHKTRFVIVDAIGVCETDKTDSRPLERKRSVPFEKLLHSIAVGVRDEDLLSSVAARLARLERALEEPERKEIEKLSEGVALKKIVSDLLQAIDPDRQEENAKELFQTETPTPEQVEQAAHELADAACQPLADNPPLRNYLVYLQQKNEQTIDTVSQDTLIWSGYDEQAREQARNLITSFKQFIEDNKDAITALQILYSKPHGQRHLTYQQVKELAEAINKPPRRLDSERLWEAYERLDEAKVKGRSPERMLADIVSLVRFAVGDIDSLEPFADTLQRSFQSWLTQQEQTGRRFTAEQREWLEMIKDYIAASLSISAEDFELTPFNNRGGIMKVPQLFGEDLESILQDMNELMAA